MLVLDYPREMTWEEPLIVVPAFHAGHLGLVAETTVNVGLLSPRRGRSNPEVVISQFETDISQLAVASVTLQNEIGVVERLTQAVSSLDINIELQESNSIDHLNQHHVTLLASMETLRVDERAPTPRNAKSLYDPYRELLPISDSRLVRLFETIVLHCFDILKWQQQDGLWMPAIEIRSLPQRSLVSRGLATVERTGNWNEIRLPNEVLGRLKSQLSSSSTSRPVPYIFVSDTEQRNLRVFFLQLDAHQRLFHVAFYHNNIPGALSTILGLVARAKFDIVTSLLRKHDPERSVWEAVLDYRGGAADPPPSGSPAGLVLTQQELMWIAGKIEDSLGDEAINGVPCRIVLNVPRYRRQPEGQRLALVDVPIGERLRLSGDVPFVPPLQLLDEATSRDNAPEPHPVLPWGDLLGRIRRRLQGSARPTVFLSYPFSADGHAALLRRALQEEFVLTDYRLADGEQITDQVEHRIKNADFFIGIWHHEEKPDGSGDFTVSPWMPFEYGIARALGKPAIVIHSEKVPRRIWNRIDPGISSPEYSDLRFGETVKVVAGYCKRKFHNETMDRQPGWWV